MVTGRAMPTPRFRGDQRPPLEILEQEVSSYIKQLSQVHRAVFNEQKRRERARERRTEPGPIQVGDWVYLRVFKRSCLDPRAEGPYRVTQATPRAVRVQGSDLWYHLNSCYRAVPPEGARGPEESEDDDGDQGPQGPPPDSPGEDDGGGEQRGGPSTRRSTGRRILPTPADDPGRNIPRVPAVLPPLSVPTGAGDAGAEPGSRRGRRHPPEVGAAPESQVSRPATASTSGDSPADLAAHSRAATTPDLTGSDAEETPRPEEEEAPPPPPLHQQGNDTINFGDFYADWDYPYPADAPADDQNGTQSSAAGITEALDALRLPAVLTPPPRTPPQQSSQLPAEPVERSTDSGHTTGGPHFGDDFPGTSRETRRILQGIGVDGSPDTHWTGGFEEALDWSPRGFPEDDESDGEGADCHPQ